MIDIFPSVEAEINIFFLSKQCIFVISPLCASIIPKNLFNSISYLISVPDEVARNIISITKKSDNKFNLNIYFTYIIFTNYHSFTNISCSDKIISYIFI